MTTNLTESVATLQTKLSDLKPNDAIFAASLIAAYKKYGSLTTKQAPWIEKLIERAQPKFVVVASSPVVSAPAVAVHVGDFSGVINLFNVAKQHLKFPKVRLSVNGGKIVLSLNGKQSKAPGAVSITSEGAYGARSYYGRVSPEGVFTPAQATYGEFLNALTDVLSELSANPARVAKDHGKLTGHCCFCNKELGLGKEQRSVLVGFGPDCAEHYGLKAEWLAAADKAEVKASVVPPTAGITYDVPVKEGKASWEVAQEPTLTVSPAAQATISGLAESLAKATGAVSVTVTDGPAVDTYGPNPGDVGDYDEAADQAKNDADKAQDAAFITPFVQLVIDTVEAQPKTCFFCEQESTETKVLHGYAVCPECVKQLV